MSSNLLHNVKEAMMGFLVTNVYGWLDSTVALHWINGNGDYKQFVRNQVQKFRRNRTFSGGMFQQLTILRILEVEVDQ
jgi:hypothetical protein